MRKRLSSPIRQIECHVQLTLTVEQIDVTAYLSNYMTFVYILSLSFICLFEKIMEKMFNKAN